MGARRPKILATLACMALALVAAGGGPASGSTSEPVLGSPSFAAPYGYGFGTQHPKVVSNGGVPSGTMEAISWKAWGDRVAYGRGLGHQYKPRGGYYRRPVEVRLRAEKLGSCPDTKPPAYTRLRVKFQKRPGGAWEDWFLWSGARSLCDPLFR